MRLNTRDCWCFMCLIYEYVVFLCIPFPFVCTIPCAENSLNGSLILYKCDLIPIFWLVSYLTTRHWKYNENVHDNSQTTISSLRIALCEKWTLKIKMAGVKSKKRALKQLKYKTQNTSTGTCFVHL